MPPDDDYDAACAHQEQLERRQWEEQLAEAHLRHEIARTAEMVAECGHCPERATQIERSLLETAGLEKFELAA